MAQSTFNTAQVFRGAFNIKNSKVTFGGLSADHLVQNIQYQFQQQIGMIYELGSPYVYFNGGRASGTANLSRILGPKVGDVDALLNSYNDVCLPNDIGITQASGCSPINTVSQTVNEFGGLNGLNTNLESSFTLKSAVLTSIGGSQDAQSAVFTEQMGFMFLDLQRSSTAA